MAENREHERPVQPIPPLENPEVTHETGDVDVKSITVFGIALVLLCIIAFGLLLGLFRFFESREEVQQRPPRPGINYDARKLPPQPRLQSAPITDLKEMRAAEDKILNGYGWVDQPKGLARIPIGQAMDLLVQRGL